MQKAERGFGSGRIVWIAVLGSLGVALAGCGSNESGSSTAATSTTTTGSNSQTAADSGSTGGSSTTSGSTTSGSTTSGSTTSGSTTSGSTTTTGSTGSTKPTTPVTGTTVTLGWVAPTENSNGTPITDLAGYKIHYGTTSENYTKVVAVSNPSLSRYVLDSLASGTYFFAITAYNSKGIESTLSGEISATLN
ncbi:MAG TPA: fibronectin type III domain-containing protein [Steroidobacteraceae bacterium]|nr:fibronectin type III domain-containing protein [Steroidobacteraceae bacterium]